MYCPKCGTENSNDAQFCSSCNAPLPPRPSKFVEPIVPKTSGLAIAAFIIGLVSILFFPLGLIAIILSIVSIVMIEKSGGRLTGKVFAILGIVIPIIAFSLLFVILMPALIRVRKQAQTVMCMSKLKQWSMVFAMYTDDYNGKFIADTNWLEPLRPYYGNDQTILLCPMATTPNVQETGTTFTAWVTSEGDTGSYGLNGWVTNPPQERNLILENFQTENNWRTPHVRSAGSVPLMMDARQFIAFPLETDTPTEKEDLALQNTGHMQRVCIDRHDKFVNVCFLDFSVRKVGLKELWKLKWHRTYDQDGPWTQAGGVKPTDWPQWMRNFKDY